MARKFAPDRITRGRAKIRQSLYFAKVNAIPAHKKRATIRPPSLLSRKSLRPAKTNQAEPGSALSG